MKKVTKTRRKIGKLIVYKKLSGRDSNGGIQTYVAELEIAATTKRCFPDGIDGKARCQKATVLRIWKRRMRVGADGLLESQGWRELKSKDASIRHRGFGCARPTVYMKGQKVVAHYYHPDETKSCVGGIHFLMTIEQARNY
jgi:hypothetical protein